MATRWPGIAAAERCAGFCTVAVGNPVYCQATRALAVDDRRHLCPGRVAAGRDVCSEHQAEEGRE